MDQFGVCRLCRFCQTLFDGAEKKRCSTWVLLFFQPFPFLLRFRVIRCRGKWSLSDNVSRIFAPGSFRIWASGSGGNPPSRVVEPRKFCPFLAHCGACRASTVCEVVADKSIVGATMHPAERGTSDENGPQTCCGRRWTQQKHLQLHGMHGDSCAAEPRGHRRLTSHKVVSGGRRLVG